MILYLKLMFKKVTCYEIEVHVFGINLVLTATQKNIDNLTISHTPILAQLFDLQQKANLGNYD